MAVCEVDVPYFVKGVVKIVPTLVIPSLAKHLILGMDFWKSFNIQAKFCFITLDCSVVESANDTANERVYLSDKQVKIFK